MSLNEIMSAPNLTVCGGVVALAMLCGCDRGEVTAYDTPKESPPSQVSSMPQSGMDPHAGMQMSRPSVVWGALPNGWIEAPHSSGMRLATFSIEGEGEDTAEMAIIPMGGFAGTDEQLVNMWRMQLGLPELAASEAEAQGESILIGGTEGHVYEMAGRAQDIDTRIIVASANKDGVNYFFKLIGNDSLVLAQKDAFVDFVKGVEFQSAAPMTAAPTMTTTAISDSEQRWTAPGSWEELPATQFLLAKYRLVGEGDQSVEVTVSKLGGSAGGLLPNVNRWRRQLNLPPVDEAALGTMLSGIKAGTVDAMLVDLQGTDAKTGNPSRMIAVTVSLPAETWFFKMTGPASLVEEKTAEFRSFVNNSSF